MTLASVFPSGRRTETLAEQQTEVPTVTSSTLRLIRSPLVPSKVAPAFCPGTEVATSTEGPPTTIGTVRSPGTS
jgi:hypothetical protein